MRSWRCEAKGEELEVRSWRSWKLEAGSEELDVKSWKWGAWERTCRVTILYVLQRGGLEGLAVSVLGRERSKGGSGQVGTWCISILIIL